MNIPCQVCGQDTGLVSETLTPPRCVFCPEPEALAFALVVYTCSAKCRDEIEASLQAASPNPKP